MNNINMFLSSTFEDLQFVRDSIQKETFPRFQELCLLNDYLCNIIDLRWGVSKAEEEAKAVIRRCLDDIDYCSSSPLFFVGVIGNRYGWSPQEEDYGIIPNERTSIIKDAIKNQWSVTELECRYAERIKGKTQSIYFLSEDLASDSTELIEFKEFLRNTGDYVYIYKDESEISKKLLAYLETWLFDKLNTPLSQRNINSQIMCKIDNKPMDEFIKEKAIETNYHDLEGHQHAHIGLAALDIYTMQKTGMDSNLIDILDRLFLEKSQKKIKNHIFAMLTTCPPNGLSEDELISILEKIGISSSETKSALLKLEPFLRKYKNRYKAIHPRLESSSTFGLTEEVNISLEALVAHYKENDEFQGDQHLAYTVNRRANLNFFCRMGGRTFGPKVLGEIWNEIVDLNSLYEHYLRRKHVVHLAFQFALCTKHELLTDLADRLSHSMDNEKHRDLASKLVEDERIIADFPYLFVTLSQALNRPTETIKRELLRVKRYRSLTMKFHSTLKRKFDIHTETSKSLYIENANNLIQSYESEFPDLNSGFILHELYMIVKKSLISDEIPYRFKLFHSMPGNLGLPKELEH